MPCALSAPAGVRGAKAVELINFIPFYVPTISKIIYSIKNVSFCYLIFLLSNSKNTVSQPGFIIHICCKHRNSMCSQSNIVRQQNLPHMMRNTWIIHCVSKHFIKLLTALPFLLDTDLIDAFGDIRDQ